MQAQRAAACGPHWRPPTWASSWSRIGKKSYTRLTIIQKDKHNQRKEGLFCKQPTKYCNVFLMDRWKEMKNPQEKLISFRNCRTFSFKNFKLGQELRLDLPRHVFFSSAIITRWNWRVSSNAFLYFVFLSSRLSLISLSFLFLFNRKELRARFQKKPHIVL